jgi:hypothetical protein
LHFYLLYQENTRIISRRRLLMKNMKFGILLVIAVLALVSVVSAALPAQVTADITYPGSASYWNVDVTSGGGDIPAAGYAGWCGSSTNGIGQGHYTFDVYSSLGSLPALLPPMDWNKVNYVINHDQGANAATLQQVFWHYDSGYYFWNPNAPLGPFDQNKYDAIIADAELNGGSYVPGPGNDYAVILWSSRNAQPVFIQLPIPEIPSPEFPTIALPVAMLIGLVGAVQYVRSRKE